MSYRCVGCDGVIPWDGEGTFYYTCLCGATLFYKVETMTLIVPASLVSAVYRLRQLGIEIESPHLDYYLGDSNYTSKVKDAITKQLLEMGFTWMTDCEQCQKDGTLGRKLRRAKHLAIVEAEQILRGSA